MEGLDLLGAEVTSLSHSFITLRVKSIDTEKLKNKLGGSTGSIASNAMPLLNSAPKAVLDMAMPFVVKTAKGYGVDLETVVSDVPPSKGGRPLSEFFPGVVVGMGLGVASFGLVKLIARLF
jgi:hypothetical protein